MKQMVTTSALALAMVLGFTAAQAGGASGGNPPPTINPCDLDPDADGCSASGDPTDPGAGGGGTTPGSGGTVTPALPAAVIPYTYGSGAKLFTLDNLPTGNNGAMYQPFQDYTNFPTPGANSGTIASAQGVLTQTVSGTTVSFHTADYIYDPADPTAPQTRISVRNDTSNFNYLGVPTGVQVGIEANTQSASPPGSIYVNFTDALSYFSINLYRISGAFDVGSTVTAYSGLDGTGSILGQVSGLVTGGTNFAFTTLQLANLNGARSFTLNGSGLSYYDDITATVGAPAATAAVPETATWAMFIGGFAFVGGALRRQRCTGVRFA